MTADVPQTVACPCGNGFADLRRETVSDPNGQFRRRLVHHYRHEGCPVGGHITTRGGHIVGRGGPLFKQTRDSVGRFTKPGLTASPAGATPTLAADGGEPE